MVLAVEIIHWYIARTGERNEMVAQRTADVRRIAQRWLLNSLPDQARETISLGLPEWDDRLSLWRVALSTR